MSDENPGYILRISKEEWLEQVFRLKRYYPGLMRRYKPGTPILFVKKADEGDSFVGYGAIDKIEMPWELPPEDEEYCRSNNWKCCITFREDMMRWDRPLPIKESILNGDNRKGSYLHGIKLSTEHVNTILKDAEAYQS